MKPLDGRAFFALNATRDLNISQSAWHKMEGGRNDVRNFFLQSTFSGVKSNVADIFAALLTVHLIAACLSAVSDEFDGKKKLSL